MAESAGFLIFLVVDQSDIDFVKVLKDHLAHTPVRYIGLLAEPRETQLLDIDGVFDDIYKFTVGDSSQTVAGIASSGSVAEIAKIYASWGKLLCVYCFEDRHPAVRNAVDQCKDLSIPHYLVQHDEYLDDLDIWDGLEQAVPRWGASSPRHIAVQSGLTAARLSTFNDSRNSFSLSGGDSILLGAHTRLGIRTDDKAPVIVAVQDELIAPDEYQKLSMTLNVDIRCWRPDATLVAKKGSVLITRIPRVALRALEAGWRSVLIKESLPHELSAGLITCSSFNDVIVDQLPELLSGKHDTGILPTTLSAEKSNADLVTIISDDLRSRIRRAVARIPQVKKHWWPTQVPELRVFHLQTMFGFNLFPFKTFVDQQKQFRRPDITRLVIITHDWSNKTGLARPVKYYGLAIAYLGIDVTTLTFGDRTPIEALYDELRPGDFVMFNSFGIFQRSDAAFDLYESLAANQRGIYLHETAYTFQRFAELSPGRYQHFIEILSDADAFCVSGKQAAFLSDTFGVKHTHIVYNTTSLSATEAPPQPDNPVIVMVGTQQARKGIELFSKVADLAKSRGKPWLFRWIGHETDEVSTLYRSDNVDWAGRLDGAKLSTALREMHTFFLSSSDDPFPLSALEAITLGKRVVCSGDTGIEEVVRGLPGCRIYDEYTPEAAFEALEAVVLEEPSQEEYKRLEEEVFGLVAFCNKTTDAINTIVDRVENRS